MKKQFVYVITNIIRNKFIITGFSLFLISGASFAQTRNVALVGPVMPVSTATVRHIGNPEGSAVFQVQYDNPLGEKFSLTIKDSDGATLYQDNYSDKKFDKKFQLPDGQSDRLKFIIKSPSSSQPQVFEVNTNTRVIEEVVVKRIG
ncbi:hypothetical protein [Paraflavitalea sp. CAU 1676]|uniref:hypothetical protein n=1 Tax=Paraflavitalea sp. CAU 1676 TaxID=3032598 RepID=UPI0023DA3AF8|nr:hypothetical protein [Paraflavitalea sp. CAU 1676]MDF2186855.1 hypothetical protein [Paraflavitalea sp. CAU 1676]